MYKRVNVPQDKEFPLDILVDPEYGPEYPLFEFKGFGSRPTKNIKQTTANYPRKNELVQSKLEALIASTANFAWMLFGWPISIFLDGEGNEWQFDHRHLLFAMRKNNWLHAPVAVYARKKTNIEVLDQLSDNSAMSLMGLRANATDGSDNAGMKDFHIIRRLMDDDKIPVTNNNVNVMLEAAGVFLRFPNLNHKGTITTIRNAILNSTVKSLRVFNTSNEEVKTWIANNSKFAKNAPSPDDGVMCYHKVLDHQFVYRYANDILKWSFAAWLKGDRVRVCASSKAVCEHQIENDRQEVIAVIKSILDNTINWYISWVEERFSVVGMSVDLPKVELSKLPLELFWIPQIEGEEKEIQVDFS